MTNVNMQEIQEAVNCSTKKTKYIPKRFEDIRYIFLKRYENLFATFNY